MNQSTTEIEETPYVDATQHREANHLGMWMFLATEILFFGGLFSCYSIYRWTYPAAFAQASNRLDFWIGTINTGVLLTSSLFMALADLAHHAKAVRLTRIHLSLTALLGAVFLGLKFYEYYQKYVEHLIPGPHFAFPDAPPQAQLFFFLYFAMTGLHAAHMIIGLCALGWLVRRTTKPAWTARHSDAVSIVGLYWHFVDCVWIFLYPLLYLAGR
ncbi:MAG TPA: cytochrome c oxidase subunit 3 family protein [Opitutaceae bacterium]|nr:cytochrome c oxidase subunit 3 family protein [Opitutaceae bacterium]